MDDKRKSWAKCPVNEGKQDKKQWISWFIFPYPVHFLWLRLPRGLFFPFDRGVDSEMKRIFMKKFQLTECIHGAWLVECEDRQDRWSQGWMEKCEMEREVHESHRIGVRNLSEQNKCQWRWRLPVRTEPLPSNVSPCSISSGSAKLLRALQLRS